MQGFNMGRYVPPDKEGIATGNALHRKRTVPATVRFEMPFAVWCNHCPKPTIIGQGVRFNATKTRVGAYHSTPIWAFRFKHAVCGGELEVRTDPKDTAYVVTEGGKRRDTGEGKEGDGEGLEGGVRILTDAEREELRKSAFKRLERTIEDREAAKEGNERIEGLMKMAQRDWSDPYERNQRLRRAFREGRKQREEEAKGVESLRRRLGLGGGQDDDGDDDDEGLRILPATREDELRAGLVEFQPLIEDDDNDDGAIQALRKPLFGNSSSREVPKKNATDKANRILKGKRTTTTTTTTKAEAAAARRKEKLVSRIAGNTRAATDPFLHVKGPSKNTTTSSAAGKLLPGVKRKRAEADGPVEDDDHETDDSFRCSANAVGSLVDYDSD